MMLSIVFYDTLYVGGIFMELSDLRIFKTVAQAGSVSAAAKELNYVQSNVTARVKKLENTLNTHLFHRHKRGMTLTPEGKKLLDHTDDIFVIVNKIEKTLQDPNVPSGKLEIGAVETVIQLPAILAKYNKRYEDVDLSLASGVTDELIDQVLNSKLDGAFITGAVTHPQLREYKVFQEELVLLAATDTNIEDLKSLPFLVFNKGCGYRLKLEQWLRDTNKYPVRMMEFGTLETILGSVISGLGVTIVPKSSVSNILKKGRAKAYILPKKYSKISTVFILRKDTEITTSIEKFIDVISNYKPETPISHAYFSQLI